MNFFSGAFYRLTNPSAKVVQHFYYLYSSTINKRYNVISDTVASPYINKSESEWKNITKGLVEGHPLTSEILVNTTLEAWDGIFDCRIGSEGFCIGKDIFPKPQVMGFLLHELIPLKLMAKYKDEWTNDKKAIEKDLVYIPDLSYSIEIKTSSHQNQIFGNRSYAQPTDNPKKDKSGYYLAVNFEKFSKGKRPDIKIIRFGWLDHSDWIGQTAATGQQARLHPSTYEYKLVKLYPKQKTPSLF